MKARILYVGNVAPDEVTNKADEMIKDLGSTESGRRYLIQSMAKLMLRCKNKWRDTKNEKYSNIYDLYLKLFEEIHGDLHNEGGKWGEFCDRFCVLMRASENNIVAIYSFGDIKSED